MTKHKLNLLPIALTVLGLPVIFDSLLPNRSALGATFNFNVSVNGKTIGDIGLNEALGSNGGRGIEGDFTPTGRTIPELLAYLGTGETNKKQPQNLNWLQIVTSSYYPPSVTGNPTAPFIDPIIGGFSRQWSDNEPWYYDEYQPNPLPSNKEPYDENYLRVANTESSKLKYLDIVRQSLGTKLTYNTFLIADYGDKTYRPLGDGFQWSIEVKPPTFPNPQFPDFGITRLTSPPESVKYNSSQFDNLVSAFGYTRRKTPLNLASTPCQAGSGLVASSGGFGLNLGGSCPSGSYYTDPIGGGIGSQPAGYSGNDDGSFGSYPLGFSFSYFGQSYNSFYINNNGNISFGKPVSAYTPNPLLTENIAPLIAPYWGDVDTRGTGTVAVRTDIPNQLIVTWDKVGYYSQHTDKLASFQLVLRGSDYAVPPNEGNVGFFYKDVQWETGDASGGSGGFGGTEAGVGFSDGLSTVNPGEISLPFSQQTGISEYVGNNSFWFNYPETATCSGASGGGGCAPALARNIASQPMLVSSIAGSNAPNAKNLSGKDNEDDALAAEAVPEPTTVLGALLAACGLATLKKLKNRKFIQP